MKHFFRDNYGNRGMFQSIAAISHHGRMTTDGEGQGHYTCDVKTKDGRWYRTNDNKVPVLVNERNLSKKCVVVLYSKVDSS